MIHTDGGTFADFSEYIRSDYFRDSRRRCLVKRPKWFGSETGPAAKSDCSLSGRPSATSIFPSRTIVLPVVFHVIQRTDGTGALSDRQIADQIEVLNEDFGAVSGSLGENGYKTRSISLWPYHPQPEQLLVQRYRRNGLQGGAGLDPDRTSISTPTRPAVTSGTPTTPRRRRGRFSTALSSSMRWSEGGTTEPICTIREGPWFMKWAITWACCILSRTAAPTVIRAAI